MLNHRLAVALLAPILGLLGAACGEKGDQRLTTTASPSSATPAASNDTATCERAMGTLSDYKPTEVVAAIGGSRLQVEHWLNQRPESQGDSPDRGLANIDDSSHLSICVLRGTYPVPHPPTPDGAEAPAAEGGRFLILPSGEAVLDAAGPLREIVKLTPTSLPAS
jgi:hypothetical protein